LSLRETEDPITLLERTFSTRTWGVGRGVGRRIGRCYNKTEKIKNKERLWKGKHHKLGGINIEERKVLWSTRATMKRGLRWKPEC